jgi:hypothetical protein
MTIYYQARFLAEGGPAFDGCPKANLPEGTEVDESEAVIIRYQKGMWQVIYVNANVVVAEGQDMYLATSYMLDWAHALQDELEASR